MLGAFTEISDLLPGDVILQKLLSQVEEKFHADDTKAFEAGRKLIQSKMK